MKLCKFVFIIVFFTSIALFYVNQQIQIIVTSYEIQQKKVKLNYLFDKNIYLRYNINRLNSPSYLFSALNPDKNKEAEFKLSRSIRVKKLNVCLEKNFEGNKSFKPKVNLFSILLGLSASAEAETLNDN